MEEDDLFVAGKVGGIHEIRGKIKVYPPSTTLQEFSPGDVIFLRGSDRHIRRYSVTSIDVHKRHILLGIEGISTADEAKGLVGCPVLIEKNRSKALPDGEFYWFQIVGLKVFTESGELLGEVKEILPTGSNDVYVVRDGQKEYLIPATESVIREINLKRRMIVIHPLEGLI
jgi:16S rRNA processing protein RimM